MLTCHSSGPTINMPKHTSTFCALFRRVHISYVLVDSLLHSLVSTAFYDESRLCFVPLHTMGAPDAWLSVIVVFSVCTFLNAVTLQCCDLQLHTATLWPTLATKYL